MLIHFCFEDFSIINFNFFVKLMCKSMYNVREKVKYDLCVQEIDVISIIQQFWTKNKEIYYLFINMDHSRTTNKDVFCVQENIVCMCTKIGETVEHVLYSTDLQTHVELDSIIYLIISALLQDHCFLRELQSMF